jgi:CBS domain-containing protein
MGEQKVALAGAGDELREFMRAVVRDLDALRAMIEGGLLETGVRRVGAEQELFLVDASGKPACVSMELLGRLDDDLFTTELGQFNLEINLEPLDFEPGCLSSCERKLAAHILRVREVAAQLGARPVLAGILPTLRASDLDLANMTPRQRYRALNDALASIGGGQFGFYIHGLDEISIANDSVMLESACTSFQVHFQVDPDEFARFYNISQVVIAPLLAAAANSPLLFGRRLWKETRIPLFQQSIDTRSSRYHLRHKRPRVRFGQHWVEESVLELYAQDVASFRLLMSGEVGEDPFELLARGEAPSLNALRIFTGTLYRWNRPCYGRLDGKPHLRIEMRALPSGPSVADEIANAALYFGMLVGLSDDVGDVREVMEFDNARANFYAAAQYGLDAQIRWFGGMLVPVRRLLAEEAIPLARQGLTNAGIRAADIDRYLGIIEERVETGRNGAQWLLDSATTLSPLGTRDEILTALTAATVSRQATGQPVHTWELARLEEGIAMKPTDLRVEEFMTTDVFSVDPDEPVSLAAHLMDWKHVRHIPVEAKGGHLVGLLSCFDVLRQYGERAEQDGGSAAVRTVMQEDPVTVAPENSMLEAIRLLRSEKVDCLPVVKDGHLVGIVTEHDFVHIVARLLQVRSADD